tara:strand:- start:414 stop:1169 length:756 start_codon:yes stop_codon:yes gene_type:complete
MRPIHAAFAKSLKPGGWLLMGTGLGVALAMGIQWLDSNHKVATTTVNKLEPQPIELVGDLRISGSPSMGSVDAPITIVEFSDFECSYCKRFHSQVVGPLQEEYIDQGLVRFVHKDLPLPFHRQAHLSARVARCAQSDNQYWEIYKRLFSGQNCLSCEGPIKIASATPEQQEQLQDCADEPSTALLVNTDLSEAELHGIRATPTLVIGPTIALELHRGRVLEGAMPWPALKQIIDEELQKTEQRVDTGADER